MQLETARRRFPKTTGAGATTGVVTTTEACHAGKVVYVEKPMVRKPKEGKRGGPFAATAWYRSNLAWETHSRIRWDPVGTSERALGGWT
jgi:hypothetical protein